MGSPSGASVDLRGLSDEACLLGIPGIFFAKQDILTANNLDAQIAAFLATGSLDREKLNTCIAGPEANRILATDEKLAELYHVDAVQRCSSTGFARPVSAGFRSS